MYRESLDCYDAIPSAMKAYLRHYGYHFSEKMLDFAVSKMKKLSAEGKLISIEPTDFDQFKTIMSDNNVTLEHDILYDGLYVFNMAKTDFFGSSLQDMKSVCFFVKDYIDDVDQADGFVFNRFYADCVRKGIPIPWERCL